MTRPATTTTKMLNPRVLCCRATALIAVVFVMLGLLAPTVSAHALIDATSPEEGVVLRSAPRQNVIEFNEGVSIGSGAVRLLDPSGTEVAGLSSEVVDGTTIVTELPELDQQGSYTVSWRAVSADGHPISGAYLFHLGAETLTEPAESVEASVPLLANVLRVLGATLALGAAAVLIATGARGQRWWNLALVGTVLAATGSVVAVGLGLTDSVSIALSTLSGRMAFVALVAAAVGACVAAAGAPTLSAALLGLLVVAVSAQGHAVALSPLWRSTTLTVLHVIAAVGWAAGLLFLLRLGPDTPPDRLRGAAARFSPWAAGSVVVLAATGTALVLGRVPFGDLLRYNYGRVAVLKLVMLVVALAMVAVNRRRLASLVAPDAATATVVTRRFLAGVRIEVLVLAAALVAGAVLSQIPPPDLTAVQERTGMFAERLEFGPGDLDLTVEPAKRGTNEIHVVALDDAGRLMGDITELKLEMRLPSKDLGPLEPEMSVITVGHSVSYADIPLDGEWEMTVTGRTDRFQEYTAVFTVPVEP